MRRLFKFIGMLLIFLPVTVMFFYMMLSNGFSVGQSAQPSVIIGLLFIVGLDLYHSNYKDIADD